MLDTTPQSPARALRAIGEEATANQVGADREQPPLAAPPPGARGWGRHWGWLLVGGLLLVEYGLFRQYAEWEIVWAYPFGCDQNVYLMHSYQTYERILDGGLGRGLKYGVGLPIPNGVMLHVQASLLYLVLGPSRLSALTLNFLYYALLQVVLVGTVRWQSGRWSLALFALGLLLAVTRPASFIYTLMDFRIDFIATCLFGVFISLVMRSRLFASCGWSAAAGAAGALLVAFRFLTTLYLAGILGLWFLLLCAALYLRRRDAAARHQLLRRLRGLATAGLLILLLAGPLVWHNRAAIRHYYIGHLNTTEIQARYEESGIHDSTERLLYYPRSILRDHTGKVFLALAALALATALAAGRFRPATAPAAEPGGRAGIGFAAACLAVPLLALTLYSTPNGLVGDIVVPALVWLAVAVALRLARMGRASPAGRVQTAWAAALAALTLVTGFSAYADALGRHGVLTRCRDDVDQVLQVSDEVARHQQGCPSASPRMSCNEVREYFCAALMGPLIYERHGVIVPLQWTEMGGGTIAPHHGGPGDRGVAGQRLCCYGRRAAARVAPPAPRLRVPADRRPAPDAAPAAGRVRTDLRLPATLPNLRRRRDSLRPSGGANGRRHDRRLDHRRRGDADGRRGGPAPLPADRAAGRD
jgi:hypothetical protein